MPTIADPVAPLLAEGSLAAVAEGAGVSLEPHGPHAAHAAPSSIPPAPGAAAAAQPRPREAARRLFLERSAVTLGQTWAEEWRADLRREGRPAAGGWPGTLREARVRVERFLLSEMSRRKMAAVTEAEREVAARAAYASARHEWCRQAEPEAP